MELNSDLVGVQGILYSCLKRVGDFTKINCKNGKEEKILLVVSELGKFLCNKNYLCDGNVVPKFTKELEDFTFFLALNTKFKKELVSEDYPHLIGILPPLSSCLFANICYGLDLCTQYGSIMSRFTIEVTQEMLEEISYCLSNSKPDEQLKAFIFLKAAAKKLYLTEFTNQIESSIENIVSASNDVLKNLNGIGVSYAKEMKEKEIYQHMGLIMLNLLDLLLDIDENTLSLRRFLECLFATTCNTFSSVSLNVFCTWAEVKYEDQPLQLIVAGRAYLVIEKYRNIDLATELISMLSTIAKKPKTINQLIDEADLSTIISKVSKADAHQHKWFKALLKYNIFHDDNAWQCVEQWYHLCDETDFKKLLNQPVGDNKSRYRNIIQKCASNLSSEFLKRTLIGELWHKDFQWHEDTQDRLVLTFNRMEAQLKETDLKDLLLLLFENVSLFFRHLYLVTFNGSQISSQVFNLTADIASINNVGLENIKVLFGENQPTDQNVSGYVKLFEAINSCGSFSWDTIILDILLPFLQKYRSDKALDTLCSCLQLLKHFGEVNLNLTTEQKIFQELLVCSAENRWRSFLQFANEKEGIVKNCVEFILKRIDFLTSNKQDQLVNMVSVEYINDPWSMYYKELHTGEVRPSLIGCILPNIELTSYYQENPDESFTHLMKILPCCVTPEWYIIFKEFENRQGFSATLNLFSDIIILLCDFAESQKKQQTENFNQIIHPLKYCLQNYGKLLAKEASKEDQIGAINCVCRMLKYIPNPVKTTEGMFLVNVLPENVLKMLAQNKEFIARVVLINDQILCKALAQKIVGTK
ncbi:uncharacterized protein LOC132708215 [Cylas formicarius]|uniref:uncharacterized protein LOC132708215 n=1 Tax=Cylas formicarius TaxID=197179 RepID=UPI0029588B8F|nr:uncharacterized protein LOC132708215 [Cylas formicarius]